jgi:hypothetical protein
LGEVAFNLTLILLSLTLAIIGAAVATRLQQRSWNERHWVETREKRTKSALATVESAARLIDKRLYRERRLLWASRREGTDEITAAQKEYQSVLFEWMDNLGRIKAELWHAFGKWAALQFEQNIHDEFVLIGIRIEAKLRGRELGSLAIEEQKLNVLGRTAYEFIYRLLELIAEEQLVGLTDRDAVTFENWNNLSIGFLVKRLFDIGV